MIAKIIRHPEFVAPCFYALRGEDKRPEVLAANGVRTSSAGEMAADFELQRSTRPRLRQAVEHIALAWPPGETDKLTNEVMVRAAMLYMDERGIDSVTTQWALVRHHDQEHPHCHLLLNRVTDDGQVLPDRHSHLRSAAACRKVEAAMGFVDAAKLGAAAQLEQATEGKLPSDVAERVQCKDLIRRALEKHLPTATTVRELREALATEGVRMKATVQQGGQLQAVVFEVDAYPGLHVKGSEVAREYSGVGLRKTLEAQAERREAAMALMEPRPHVAVPAIPEVAAVLPAIRPASATSLESVLPVVVRQVLVIPTEGSVAAALAPVEAGKLSPTSSVQGPASVSAPATNQASIPMLEKSISLPVFIAAVVLPPTAGLTEASEPLSGRAPLGPVVPADMPAAGSPRESVPPPPRSAPDIPEGARQAELVRQAAEVTAALAGIKREWGLIESLRQQADQAEAAGDYMRVAELRYNLVQEAEKRIDAHQGLANATPTGRASLADMQAKEQERINLDAEAKAAAHRQLAAQHAADTARHAAEVAQKDGLRLANAAVAAEQRAQQQVTEYRTQAESAEQKGDYAHLAALRFQHLPLAEQQLQRCQEQLLAPSIQASLAQAAAEQKAQQERAHAAREQGQLAELESFRGRWPYPGTHVRLQVPVEHLSMVTGAIRQHNYQEYDYEEHANKSRSWRVVAGKVSINVLYRTDENAVKLDDALREFRKNGVEVFEQPADRTKREEKAADMREVERSYSQVIGQKSASAEKSRDSNPGIEM
jgi:Relaxase/Mobilisation nuclease domain